tara:strand:+ start:159 stop:1256 length:1098 start_codon:yes stop_codon:yes gene_type:complete
MAITINGTNGIGVGTTPSHPLDIEVSSGDGVARIHAAENNNASEARLRLEVSNDFAESIVETYDSSGIGGSLKYNHGDNAWRFSTTGDTERMRIDSSGNVGIGTTSPDGLLSIKGTSDTYFYLQNDTTGTASGDGSRIGFTGASSILRIQNQESSDIAFHTAGSECMRIKSTGRVGIGETSPSKMFEVNNTASTNVSCCFMHNDGSDNIRVLGLRNDRATGGTAASMIEFFKSDGTKVGSIEGDGSSTSYNTSSDYRLKENVTPISDGITRLKTLKPSRFNFKVNKDTTVDGFLAHEVTAVPEAVTGTKDQVATADDVNDEIKEGDPIYQSIDQSKLVPLLTAALQEAIAKIETLETKVAALEAA